MKRVLHILLAVSCLAVLSCKEDIQEPEVPVKPDEKEELITRSLTLRLKKMETKVAASETGGVAWEKGDVVRYANAGNGVVRTATVGSAGGLVSLPFQFESTCKSLVAILGGTEFSGSGKAYVLRGALHKDQDGTLGAGSVFAGVLDPQASGEQVLIPLQAAVRFSFGVSGVRTLVFRSADGTPVCSADGQVNLAVDNGSVKASVPNPCDSVSVAVTDDGTFCASLLPCVLGEGYILRAYDAGGNLLAAGTFPAAIGIRAGDLFELGRVDEVLTPTEGHGDFNWDGKDYFVTQDGAGEKNGKNWENAMSAPELCSALERGLASEDATVRLARGTYKMNVTIGTGTYTCHFEGGYPEGLSDKATDGRNVTAFETVISGNEEGRIFQVNAPVRLYFDGIGFTSAKAQASSEYGGVACLNDAKAVFQVSNARLSGNYAYRGGVISVNAGRAGFHNCVFENNAAHDRGGVFNASSADAFLYFNKCSFVSNHIDGGEWGTVASCNSQSTVAMNNCVSHGNYSSESSNDPTFNGQHFLTVANCTFIEETRLRGILRLENTASGKLINSLVINTGTSRPAVTMNNGQYRLTSHGHNIIGSVDGAGAQSFLINESDKSNVPSLNAQWIAGDGNYRWDEQPDDFNPASVEEVRAVLTSDFLSWLASVDPDALTTDRNGRTRNTSCLRPGSYEGTHIHPSAKVQIKPSTTTYAMLREKVKLTFLNIYTDTSVLVDWGDGASTSETLGANGTLEHEYTSAGTYSISATAGDVSASYSITVAGLLSLDKAMDELYSADKCWVMSHRAHLADWSIPENSVAAVNASIAAGVDCLELDTHITADGVVVVCHDQTINATTNGSGTITNMTLAQIKSYNLKDRNGRVTSEKMPTLEEYLLAARGKIYVNLDYSPRTASTAQVMAVVEKLGMNGQVLYYCNSEEKMEEVLTLNPDAQAYINHSFYNKLTGRGRYFIQATWNNTLGTSSGYAVNARNANAGGLLVSVNLLHVLSDYISDKHIDPDQVSSLFYVFPSCKMIMTDCPEELLTDLAGRGKR